MKEELVTKGYCLVPVTTLEEADAVMDSLNNAFGYHTQTLMERCRLGGVGHRTQSSRNFLAPGGVKNHIVPFVHPHNETTYSTDTVKIACFWMAYDSSIGCESLIIPCPTLSDVTSAVKDPEAMEVILNSRAVFLMPKKVGPRFAKSIDAMFGSSENAKKYHVDHRGCRVLDEDDERIIFERKNNMFQTGLDGKRYLNMITPMWPWHKEVFEEHVYDISPDPVRKMIDAVKQDANLIPKLPDRSEEAAGFNPQMERDAWAWNHVKPLYEKKVKQSFQNPAVAGKTMLVFDNHRFMHSKGLGDVGNKEAPNRALHTAWCCNTPPFPDELQPLN